MIDWLRWDEINFEKSLIENFVTFTNTFASLNLILL